MCRGGSVGKGGVEKGGVEEGGVVEGGVEEGGVDEGYSVRSVHEILVYKLSVLTEQEYGQERTVNDTCENVRKGQVCPMVCLKDKRRDQVIFIEDRQDNKRDTLIFQFFSLPLSLLLSSLSLSLFLDADLYTVAGSQ